MNEKGKAYEPKWYIETPSILVNQHLYKGGIPTGAIMQIQSDGEGTSKTSMALQMASTAQKMGVSVGYIDAEAALNSEYDNDGNLHNEWLEKNFGLDPTEMYFCDPGPGEDIWNTIYEWLEAGVQFIIMDSIHAVSPTKYHEGEIGAHTIGGHAMLHTRGLLKSLPLLRKHDAILVGINHLRVNITPQGAMGSNPAGGKGWGFYSQFIFQTKRTTAKSKIVGQDIIPLNIYIQKNKGGASYIDVNTYVRQGYGIASDIELGLLAQQKKLVERKGSWWKTADGESVGQSADDLGTWAILNKDLILQQ